MTPKWLLVALLGMGLLVSGCVYNDDDDGGDEGAGEVSGGYQDGDDEGKASGEARGSPGWGLLGSIGAVMAVGYIVRKRLK